MAIRYVLTAEHLIAPFVICDQCGERITDVRAATAVSSGELRAPGDTVLCAYLHNGGCIERWSELNIAYGTDELATHLSFLIQNVGLPLTAGMRKAWHLPRPLVYG